MELITTFIWILIAGLIGLLISGVFAGKFKLSRKKFLIPYVIISIAFVILVFFIESVNLYSILIENWIWGILAGGIVGIFLVKNVFSQPSSRNKGGKSLIVDMVWSGLAYGVTDSLLLNIFPVLIVWFGFSSIGWTTSLLGLILVSIIGLISSLFVTTLYHIGYPEFRNKKLILVLFGNTLITLAYIIPANPLGAIISHTLMHLAAVYRGAETTVQLPPHY